MCNVWLYLREEEKKREKEKEREREVVMTGSPLDLAHFVQEHLIKSGLLIQTSLSFFNSSSIQLSFCLFPFSTLFLFYSLSFPLSQHFYIHCSSAAITSQSLLNQGCSSFSPISLFIQTLVSFSLSLFLFETKTSLKQLINFPETFYDDPLRERKEHQR